MKTLHLPSLAAVRDGIPKGEYTQGFFKASLQDGRSNPTWYGVPGSCEAVVALGKNGWPDGAAKITKLTEGLEAKLPPPLKTRKRPCWSEEGDEWDWDRRYEEKPWRRKNPSDIGPIPRGFISIYVNTGARASLNPEQFFWRGVAACTLADRLENAFFRTEIISFTLAVQGGRSNEPLLVSIKVKDFDEPLDQSRLAFACACVGVHRTYMFAARALAGWSDSGGSIYETDQDQRIEGGLNPEGFFVENLFNEQDALDFVQNGMTKTMKTGEEVL
jgi:hypothetical protein